MARYIDEKDVYKLVEPTGVARVHCSQIDELPRADVVPKSEVDKTIAEWAYLHADVLNKLENMRAEYAREIFEEIDVLVDDWKHSRIQSIQFIAELAELKKRNTRRNSNEV
jgi:hypothetical protein